jgi:DNA-binding CsgD family transcriptional regulator
MMHGQQDEQEVESAVEQNEHLTEREADVLRLLARGRSYARAAAVLQAVRLGLIL